MNRNISLQSLYTGLLGLATLVFGLADIFVWAGAGPGLSFGILEIDGGDFFRWAWGGLIMVFGGLFMLGGAKDASSVEQQGKVLLGAIMVWIVACTDIFARFCESVPAGEEVPEFFNSLTGFMAGFAPPYPPAVILLPFTLVIVYLAVRHEAEE